MKNATQLKALIRNLAKEKSINAQILLRNYMLERLLERISCSDFKNNFILKGGMLIAAMVGVDLRATVDMDATIKGYPLTEETIKRTFEAILAVQIDDGVVMTIKNIEEIRNEAEYTGLRVALEAVMGTAKIPLKVDITAGDQITPKEVVYHFNLLLEPRTIDILAYNLETVLAEKLETIITRGVANTRMRDFYDVFILSELHMEKLDSSILSEAIRATSDKRGTINVLVEADMVFGQISESAEMRVQWKRYQETYSYAEDISWHDVVTAVKTLWNLNGKYLIISDTQ